MLEEERITAEALCAVEEWGSERLVSVGLEKLCLPKWMSARRLLPLRMEAGRLLVAVADPLPLELLDDLSLFTGLPVEPRRVDGAKLEEALQRRNSREPASLLGGERKVEEGAAGIPSASGGEANDSADAPVVGLVDRIFAAAIRQRASDIHLEPTREDLLVRIRVDGRLRMLERIPRELQAAVVNRIKLISQLSIEEKRLPQDGRARLEEGRGLDVRVSTLPSIHGESVVLRLLDSQERRLDLEELGMLPPQEESMQRMIRHSGGLILVTGPTGSGKSTTLYCLLEALRERQRRIITVEDPVEYRIRGINQLRVRSELGLDFAGALRSILRQSPDVIMVGEIRDGETAAIATQAALTGHQVFSTLHTNDSCGAAVRLNNLGVKPFLVAAALRGVVAQRLVRTLCRDCRKRRHASPFERRALDLGGEGAELPLWEPAGCRSCRHSGFRGRKGIFEILEVDEALNALLAAQASTQDLRKHRRDCGAASLREDGLAKVLLGWTSLPEVLRATVADL